MLAILNTFSFKLLPLPCNIEAVAVEIVCRRPIILKPIIFYVLYISPSANNNYHAQVSKFLHSLPLDIARFADTQ